jgi:hypothetical protein
MWGQIKGPMTIDHWYIGFRDQGSGNGEWGPGNKERGLGAGDRSGEQGTGIFIIFSTETYQILTRKMTDVATELYNFPYYANNSIFYTYGNIYNTYSYDTEQDFKRTLDYVVFRKPRMQDNLDIKVLDYR